MPNVGTRPRGHYWIKLKTDKPEDPWRMASWSGGHWTIIGKVVPYIEREVSAVDSRRIDPPRAFQHRHFI